MYANTKNVRNATFNELGLNTNKIKYENLNTKITGLHTNVDIDRIGRHLQNLHFVAVCSHVSFATIIRYSPLNQCVINMDFANNDVRTGVTYVAEMLYSLGIIFTY